MLECKLCYKLEEVGMANEFDPCGIWTFRKLEYPESFGENNKEKSKREEFEKKNSDSVPVGLLEKSPELIEVT
jgi:hypothetical protein